MWRGVEERLENLGNTHDWHLVSWRPESEARRKNPRWYRGNMPTNVHVLLRYTISLLSITSRELNHVPFWNYWNIHESKSRCILYSACPTVPPLPRNFGSCPTNARFSPWKNRALLSTKSQHFGFVCQEISQFYKSPHRQCLDYNILILARNDWILVEGKARIPDAIRSKWSTCFVIDSDLPQNLHAV